MKWLQNNAPISVQTGSLPDRTSLSAALLAHFPVITIEVHVDNVVKVASNCLSILLSQFY